MVTNVNRFRGALKRLSSAAASSSQPGNANFTELKEDVIVVCRHADRNGLVNSELSVLLKIIVKPHCLDQTSLNALLKSLFPIERIPNDLVLLVVAALGIGGQKASNTTQQALVKWLALVFDLIDLTVLSKCYAVLFNLLDVLYLRAPLCYLLARITRRKHVNSCRVETLQHLEAGITTDSSVQKLASVFEFVKENSFEGRKRKLPIIFNHPDTQWTDQHQTILQSVDTDLHWYNLSADDLRIGRRATHEPQDEPELENPGKQAQDLNSLDDIVSNLGKVELQQLPHPGSGFARLQHYIGLETDTSASRTTLRELRDICEGAKTAIEGGDSLSTDLLDLFLQYARYWKELPQPALDFLRFYLPHWRSALEFEYEDLLLEVLSYIPIMPWSDLKHDYLNFLEASLIDDTIEALHTLLTFYTALLERWTMTLLSTGQPPTAEQSESAIALANHSALLSETALVFAESPSQLTVDNILSHLEGLLPLASAPISIPLAPPPTLLISTILFASPTLSTLSRTSTLLARYKLAFETPPTAQGQTRSSLDINTLNAALLDTCNLLLRSRAFNKTDTHAQGCLVPDALLSALTTHTAALSPSIQLQHAFSLSCHPALAVLSSAAFREIEERAESEVKHAGPVGQKSLGMLAREGGMKMGWREYRVQVLKWLEGVGAGGIGDLGRATMRGLMGGEKGRESEVARVG